MFLMSSLLVNIITDSQRFSTELIKMITNYDAASRIKEYCMDKFAPKLETTWDNFCHVHLLSAEIY